MAGEETAPSETSAYATPMTAVPAAPVKQDRRAISGLRAEKIRCMKSMATMSPMPSATSVAQLIGAPASVGELLEVERPHARRGS